MVTWNKTEICLNVIITLQKQCVIQLNKCLASFIYTQAAYDLGFSVSPKRFTVNAALHKLYRSASALLALFHCMVRHGTVHFWGVFHWVLYLVPDTFLVPLRSRFQASRTVTKTWRVNSADHWLAGENRHYCVTELATRDPPLQPDPLDLNQHSQRRIGRNFCLNKRTFLHQPQNSSVVVCWGSSDVPLVDSRGADPARAWWHDAEGKSLMCNVTFELAIFSEYVFCLYFYLCICVLLQLKTIWSNKYTSRLY